MKLSVTGDMAAGHGLFRVEDIPSLSSLRPVGPRPRVRQQLYGHWVPYEQVRPGYGEAGATPLLRLGRFRQSTSASDDLIVAPLGQRSGTVALLRPDTRDIPTTGHDVPQRDGRRNTVRS